MGQTRQLPSRPPKPAHTSRLAVRRESRAEGSHLQQGTRQQLQGGTLPPASLLASCGTEGKGRVTPSDLQSPFLQNGAENICSSGLCEGINYLH